MWKAAIENAVEKTRQNTLKFGGQFPHVGNNGHYLLNDNNEWTSGFWSGILWLCYEYTGDEYFRQTALQTVKSFENRLELDRSMRHHDIGFLYSLSTKAQWIIEKDEAAKHTTIRAADALMRRWRPKAEMFQAWGPEGDPNNGGKIIIDCLMNLPLLYWAFQATGNRTYFDTAVLHAHKSRKFLVRGDDSSYHTFIFDQENGEPVKGGTHQGYMDGSTWTRGQAWGIYGFILSYYYTGDASFKETSLRMANYFIDRLPDDHVMYWDFDAPETPDTKRDSSASAIAACGIMELLKFLPDDHPDRRKLEEGVSLSMKGLIEHYSTMSKPDSEGFLERGSYSVRHGNAPDDFTIWGDYYYLEALMRMEKGHKGYWYE
jgi:unsaturated chondroitin disaccharide hydrolase